jgi:hypothetical protein
MRRRGSQRKLHLIHFPAIPGVHVSFAGFALAGNRIVDCSVEEASHQLGL